MAPFVIPVCMYACGASLLTTLVMWTWVVMTGSILFTFIGFTVGHHDPELFHDGDAPR